MEELEREIRRLACDIKHMNRMVEELIVAVEAMPPEDRARVADRLREQQG
jgi:hypothetical protein